MDIRLQIISSIKQCMMHKSLTKHYIKILRMNKNIRPMKINRKTKNGLSVQFQDYRKTSLVIPRRCNQYHIQFHLDKRYRLIKYMRYTTKSTKVSYLNKRMKNEWYKNAKKKVEDGKKNCPHLKKYIHKLSSAKNEN